jgi:hypothetical protein
MTLAFYQAVRGNFMMPGGGQLGCGEIAGLDPSNPINAAAISAGIIVPSGAPPAYVAPSMTRIKFTETTMVNNEPPLYDAGEVAGLPSAIAAQLIAAGLAVAN